jgi:hypothetical protein
MVGSSGNNIQSSFQSVVYYLYNVGFLGGGGISAKIFAAQSCYCWAKIYVLYMASLTIAMLIKKTLKSESFSHPNF